MKHITLHIPENKYPFFMELLKNFDYVKIEENDIVIPEEHKKIVRERLQKSKENPSRILDWNKVKDNFKLMIKYKN